jgi:hypothetical protein
MPCWWLQTVTTPTISFAQHFQRGAKPVVPERSSIGLLPDLNFAGLLVTVSLSGLQLIIPDSAGLRKGCRLLLRFQATTTSVHVAVWGRMAFFVSKAMPSL